MPKQASEYKSERRLKYLLCGDPGTGKSVLAASAAKWGPVYIFDIDGRFASVYNYYKDSSNLFGNISYDTYQFFGRETQAAREIAVTLEAFQKTTKEKGSPPYSTVIFDSWTNWESLMLAKIMGDSPNLARKKVDFGGLIFAAPDGKNDYMLHSQGQRMFVKQLMGIAYPMNVIVVAHTKTVYDEFQRPHTRIAAAGQLEKHLAIDFDEVHLLQFEKNVRKLCVVSDKFPTKTSLKDVDKGVVDADLSVFDDRVFNKPTGGK